jgi:hypothetical protein
MGGLLVELGCGGKLVRGRLVGGAGKHAAGSFALIIAGIPADVVAPEGSLVLSYLLRRRLAVSRSDEFVSDSIRFLDPFLSFS